MAESARELGNLKKARVNVGTDNDTGSRGRGIVL